MLRLLKVPWYSNGWRNMINELCLWSSFDAYEQFISNDCCKTDIGQSSNNQNAMSDKGTR